MSLSEHPPLPAPGEGGRFHWPFARFRDDTRRVLPVLVPVIVTGAVGLVLAFWWFASSGPTWPDLAGIGVLLAAATVAEVFPVPIEGVAGNTSLATIFLVSVAAIYGWAAGGIVGFLTMVLAEAWRRPPFVRIAFNPRAPRLPPSTTAPWSDSSPARSPQPPPSTSSTCPCSRPWSRASGSASFCARSAATSS